MTNEFERSAVAVRGLQTGRYQRPLRRQAPYRSLNRIVETVRLLNNRAAGAVKSSAGLLELQTPRDRTGSYQPQIVPKRQVVLTPQLEQKVLSLYSVGNSYADISQHLLDMYGYSLSDSELTAITDKVIPAMREWQNRPLESLYTLVWLDGIYYKVRHDGKVVTRVLYSVIGLSLSGKKQVLGIYTAESDGAAPAVG